MNQSPNPSSAVVEIDLLQLIEAIWKRIWIVLAATLICGLLAFVTAKFIITPTYRSSARMYVNNATERSFRNEKTHMNVSGQFDSVKTASKHASAMSYIKTCVIDILPDRIAEIVEGSSAKVVSEAKLPTQKAAPNVSKYTLVGLLLGFVASCGVIVVLEMLDTTVHDSTYLTETYDIPVLAVVPDMTKKKKHSGYYGDYYRKEA